MQSCTLAARAKINLYLEILGQRADGYHEVAMVLQSVELADHLHLTLTDSGIQLQSAHPDIPLDHQNLAYRAAHLLRSTYPCPGGVNIHIEKRIPVAAGLAGGSTNAAAVLVGLNQLWGLGLITADLQTLAAQLGSDVPFCISGGTQLATGRGEVLEPLLHLGEVPLVLAKPRSLSVSTAWAYRAYQEFPQDSQSPQQRNQMLQTLNIQHLSDIAQHLHNDLEKPVLAHHPQVSHLKQRLMKLGALGSMMSGSGPTVFGLMPSLDVAEKAATTLQQEDPDLEVFTTQTAPTGISLYRED
ncbi:MAG: 4-(cytidine 5'-diphospho)-2-C-methyl-D-erythritol kinase [Synechococcaceae cyanobacterium SM2_3_1]|nr:4-(cytidine 5'-diphospho)-2-C-methyl-D-erythritol kinase [Synechococcaceae cyanobacterium SM2_3_1]